MNLCSYPGFKDSHTQTKLAKGTLLVYISSFKDIFDDMKKVGGNFYLLGNLFSLFPFDERCSLKFSEVVRKLFVHISLCLNLF